MAGAQIGALSVVIGADVSGLTSALGKADRALLSLNPTINQVVKSTTQLTGTMTAAAAVVLAFTQHAANAADEAGKMAQKIGLTVEGWSSLSYAGKLANVSAEELGIGLRKLSQQMLEVQSGSLEAKQGFKALKVETDDGKGNLRAVDQVLLDVAEKFSRMEDGAGKTALAMRLFGKSGNELIPLLNQGRAGIEALRKEAERLGIVISAEMAKQAEEYNDNMRRLKASSEGLALALAGPLVEALGKAAKAMVDAKRDGDGFFATLVQGWQMLVSGDDAHKWNVQFTDAVDKLVVAQGELERAKANIAAVGHNTFDDEAVKRWSEALAKARAEVDRLQKIKPVLLGPEEEKAAPKKDKAPPLVDLQKQMQRDQEVRDAMHRARVADDDRELTQVERTNSRLEDVRQRGLAAEADIAMKEAELLRNPALQDAGNESTNPEHDRRLMALRQSVKSLEELENEEYRTRVAELKDFSDQELQVVGGRQAAEQQLEAEHWDRLREIRTRNLSNLADFSRANWTDQTAYMIGSLEQMTAGAAQHSERMFKIWKMAAIANAVVKGWEAIQSSYAFGAEWGGPIAGAAMAAIAAAATAVNINAIKDTTFKGGGAVPTFSANAVSGMPQQTATPTDRNLQTTIIHLPGTDLVSTRAVRELLQKIDEHNRNGGRVVVA